MEPVIVQYHEQLKGILTPELFLAQKTLDPDYRNQIEDLIHQGEKPRLLLLKLVAVEQDIKQFLPPVWYKTAHVIKEEDRRIVRKNADGNEVFMIKSPRMQIYGSKSPAGTKIHIEKSSVKETAHTLRLQRAGVLVAEPLGYFVQGNEQYAYSAFVEGRSPLDLLAEEKERQQIWDTDADMLARMCNAHLKQRGFYSEKFDDKIWTPQGLVLIDCDEAVDLDEYDTCAGLQGESLRTYHDETLRTALYHYVENNQLTEKEAFQYAKKFLEVRGDNPERAKELSTDLENSLIDEELWRYMRDHPEI